MTQVEDTQAVRRPRRPVDKFDQRRAQLADSALQTLAERGYARTSLREIAQNSEFSHGVFHYYFQDKVELITYCVRQYKAECVRRYDEMVSNARTADELANGFATALAGTLRAEASMHRLWYDLRNQSMFEESFHHDALEIDNSIERMVWRIIGQFAELSGATLIVDSPTAYAAFDGLFQRALFRHLAGDAGAIDQLQDSVGSLLATMLAPSPETTTVTTAGTTANA